MVKHTQTLYTNRAIHTQWRSTYIASLTVYAEIKLQKSTGHENVYSPSLT